MVTEAKPSVLETIATAAGKVQLALGTASGFIAIADVGIAALVTFLHQQGVDDEALATLHAEYQKRIAAIDAELAADPSPGGG